ncbi:hypothetical protein BC938DRAFT_472722 [Jimgerdemannia flammicorona]|uniref:Chromatin assembly factor 1 subunit A-domain-containing protein n=1 Tax=Jimgerdemannia flammicorona TaxID=994334 RepID=A0A433Q5J1_9FUNG|nr:hypothetical protein BC938DRAFT_472722 [Jimgerdemannia flammicorona]
MFLADTYYCGNADHESKDGKPSPAEKSKSVDFKNGKLIFSDKRVSLENHPKVISELAKFHQYCMGRSDKENQGGNIEMIPHDYMTVVAMLVQDSDETLSALVKRLTEKLCPAGFNEDDSDESAVTTTLSPKVVETAIQAIATRRGYGVSEAAVRVVDGANCFSVPVHLLAYRWEVNDLDATSIIKELKEGIEKRRAKREQLSIEATRLFAELPVEQQVTLLTTGGKRKRRMMKEASAEAAGFNEAAAGQINEAVDLKVAKDKLAKETAIDVGYTANAVCFHTLPCLVDAERKAKEAEKLAKIKAKEAEKRKKEKAQPKLNNWIMKREEPTKNPEESQVDPNLAGYLDYFKPFNVKPGMIVVEHNRFAHPVMPDFDELVFADANRVDGDEVPAVQEESGTLLRQFFSIVHPMYLRRRGVSRRVDLRQVLQLDTGGGNGDGDQASDAMDLDNVRGEAAPVRRGDTAARGIKMKFLEFAENVRPAYYGTWTKHSKSVSGCRPFAKDVELLDYNYDSEEEWEEEGEGEDLKSDDEEEKEDREDASDLDEDDENDWVVPEGYLSEGEGLESETGSQKGFEIDRERDEKVKQVPKRRGPIKQVVIGPIFEDTLADSTELDQCRIEVLFDLDFPIDPFKPIVFPVTEETVADVDAEKKMAGRGKAVFPDEHLAELVDIVHEKAMGMVKLVEEAKAILTAVPKTSIEAKIKEIAKRWRVRDDVLQSLGRDIGSPAKVARLDAFVTVNPGAMEDGETGSSEMPIAID